MTKWYCGPTLNTNLEEFTENAFWDCHFGTSDNRTGTVPALSRLSTI